MAPIPSLLAAVVILLSSSSVSVFAGLPVVDDGSSAGSLAVLPVPQSTNMRRREVPDTFVEGAAAYHIRHARDLPAVDYESASAMKSAGMRVTLPVTLGGAAGMPGGGRVGAREEAEVKMLERRTEGGGAYLPITARGLPAVDFDFAGGTGSAMGKVTLPVAQMSGMAKPAVKPRALEPTIAGGGFLHLPVIHSTNGEHFGDLQLRSPFEEGGPAAHLARRGFQVSLANRSDVAYYAKLAIGNPPQQVYVQLDTGSFELWVNPSCADLTGSDVRFCQAVGRYEVSQSTTARTLPGQGRTLKYGIGSANIEYVVDDVALGDITATSPGVSTTQQLKQIQFGAAVNTTDQFAGILGIGYGLNITVRYKNFVDELADQGLIQKKAFSLALGSKSEQSGSLSFGAYDTSKFAGNLARLPIVPAAQSPDGVPRYWVSMQRMTLTPPSKRVRTYPNSTLPVFLDSGATLTLLPAPLAAAVAADFGSTRLDENGFYPVDCALQDLDGTVDFVFDGITVAVSYREIIRNIPTNPPTCYLGIVPNADFILLGDTFLRSAYAIFDLDENTVYMQQYSNCGTRLSAITPSTDFTSIRGDCPVTRAQQTSSSGVATASPSGVAGTSSSGGVVGLGPPSNGGTFSTMPNPGAAGQGSGNVPPAADGGFPPGTLGLGSGGASVRYGGWRTNAAVISTLVALVAGLI